MVRWEHRYLLGTMVFTIAGDVVRDLNEEYEEINKCLYQASGAPHSIQCVS
jgi:hypothetical protein